MGGGPCGICCVSTVDDVADEDLKLNELARSLVARAWLD